MLTVGIKDNIVVSKAIKNEQGTFEIELTQPGNNDAVAALTGSGELRPDQSANIRVYKPEVVYFQTKRDGKKMLSLVVNFKNVLLEILQIYIENPAINATKGLPTVTQENAKTMFEDQANVDKAYTNIVDQFIAQIQPHLNSSTTFRAKLPRRSPEYAFPTLPTFGPWIESMEIPAERTTLKWTPWELKNGKNDPTIPEKSEDSETVTKEVEDLTSLFPDTQ
jgi:hypothetical protein